jgi:hypothetical protein
VIAEIPGMGTWGAMSYGTLYTGGNGRIMAVDLTQSVQPEDIEGAAGNIIKSGKVLDALGRCAPNASNFFVATVKFAKPRIVKNPDLNFGDFRDYIDGRLAFETPSEANNQQGHLLEPARRIKVELLDAGKIVDSNYTNDFGEAFFNDLPFSNFYSIKVLADYKYEQSDKVIAEAGVYNIPRNLENISNLVTERLHEFNIPIEIDDLYKQSKNILVPVENSPNGRASAPWNILFVYDQATRLMQSALPEAVWENIPRVHFAYSQDDDINDCHYELLKDGDSEYSTIRISGVHPDSESNDVSNEEKPFTQLLEFNDFAIAHEIGHFVTRCFKIKQSLGGTHDLDSGKWDWTLTMDEGLSHMFAHNVITALQHPYRHDAMLITKYQNNNFKIHNIRAIDTKNGPPMEATTTQKISGPYMELAVARTMWGIQQKAFSTNFSKIVNTWNSLQNKALANIYSVQEIIDNSYSEKSEIVTNEMEIRKMFHDGDNIILHKFGEPINHLSHTFNVTLESAYHRPIFIYSLDTVKYYYIEPNSFKPTTLEVKGNRRNVYSIDILSLGQYSSNPSEVVPEKDPIPPPDEAVSTKSYGLPNRNDPYVVRIRMRSAVSPSLTLTFIKENSNEP